MNRLAQCNTMYLIGTPVSNYEELSNVLVFFLRYQDKNTSALFLLKASTRWLAFRGNCLSNFLVTSVSAGALFATQNPGIYS